MMGQGGILTSAGMHVLANSLAPYGAVTVHSWNDVGLLADISESLALNQTVIVIGYSLGANQLGWISRYIKKKIKLGVAIDPSKQSPLVESAEGGYVQSAPMYEKLVCFYHPQAWIFGGAKYVGENVELVPITGTHLGFQFDAGIYNKIIKEVAETPPHLIIEATGNVGNSTAEPAGKLEVEE